MFHLPHSRSRALAGWSVALAGWSIARLPLILVLFLVRLLIGFLVRWLLGTNGFGSIIIIDILVGSPAGRSRRSENSAFT